ncbi:MULTISPECIES: EexN family lipoprotein [unclassified Pantoea]|uniref:EexN family lipoprotein n=1 Tax=unclassified Pantoea TaxID=2630326 RepID=UPI00247753FF|nr:MULTISPECIES: EexN family lipoprotein [unclassified Pantoea]GME34305.1 hypothetical protein ACJ3_13290 [Pantoea sp. QMID3]GME34610.1 hypothetical protein ACJ1_13210 [Pantoea sp. QMID1]GME55567.1 hypothetical protein ACJ4_19930 [Pantoea sp. QMID4]GME56611.1 hypothetical protein ACJ2_19950 [Pantoea sp. QMID2]
MKKGLLSLVLLVTTLLTGFDAGAKGIDWYKAHDAVRKAKYEECTNASDPRGAEDCRNAIDAAVYGGSFTKSPNKIGKFRRAAARQFFCPSAGTGITSFLSATQRQMPGTIDIALSKDNI